MARKTKHDDEMRNHYDFSGGERGKYAARYAKVTNVVILAFDVAEMLVNSVAMNEALQAPVRTSAKTVRAKAALKKPLR